MQDDPRRFFELAIKADALRFGEFTLKSGRLSPYFFNAGLFNDGSRLAALSGFYARAILRHVHGDFMLYGPAYKGIALAAATAITLANEHQRNVRYAFNRKEHKDHGEGGELVGAPLTGDVVIVDDVITAGLSISEAVRTIEAAGARPVAVVIALDREELDTGAEQSASARVTQQCGIPVHAVACFSELLAFLEADPGQRRTLDALRRYRRQYGAPRA